jgi:hypothetical protein
LVSSGGFTTEYTDDINLLELSAGLVKRLPAKLLLQRLFTTEDMEDFRAGAVFHRKDAGLAKLLLQELFTTEDREGLRRVKILEIDSMTLEDPGFRPDLRTVEVFV